MDQPRVARTDLYVGSAKSDKGSTGGVTRGDGYHVFAKSSKGGSGSGSGGYRRNLRGESAD